MTSAEYWQARQRMGLSKAALGQLVGMPARDIWRIEERRQPTLQQAAAIRIIKAAFDIGVLNKIMEEIENEK